MENIENVKSETQEIREILLYFKVNPCGLNHHKGKGNSNNGKANDRTNCFGYHHAQERRRPPFKESCSELSYQPGQCFAMNEKGVCHKGENCKFSHNQTETSYHPLRFKTEPCQGCVFTDNVKLCPSHHFDERSRQSLLEMTKYQPNSKNEAKPSGPGQAPFDLGTFKSIPCMYKGGHNPKVCEYFHHDKDKRRSTVFHYYSSNLCRHSEKGQTCANGEKCHGCHNKVEQLYHPERYKRKFCLAHPHNIQKCEYGNYCSFAHNENEIKIELLHNIKKDESFYLYKFKTVYCPYIYEHDRNQCVYAHNPQDFRRDPKVHHYLPIQCPLWSQKQIFSYEEGGCPKQLDCEHCHGWKEMEYHSSYYKTKFCNNGKKCNKKDCPFYHSNIDKRDPQKIPIIKPAVLNSPQPEQKEKVNNNNTNNVPAAEIVTHTNTTTNTQIPDDSAKLKFPMRNESNYTRPILPVFLSVNNKESTLTQEISTNYLNDISTRPNSNNSNISSIYYTVEEDQNQKRSKKKKTKRMSLQGKKEKPSSPFSVKSDKPKCQIAKDSYHTPQVNIWKYSNIEKQDGFEEFFNPFDSTKPLDWSKTNESFDSLQSFTIEKNTGIAESYSDLTANQFRQNLFANLERKGLEHMIQPIINSNIDLETLKTFSPKDFSMLPQINTEEKKKLAKIIHDMLEEEAILLEINSIQTGQHFSNFHNEIEERDFQEMWSSYENSQETSSKIYNLFSKCS